MGVLKTSSVFKSGKPTYLRFTQFARENMAAVECFGVSEPGPCLNLAWMKTPCAASAPPKPGTSVKVHSLTDGVLYVVSGEVVDVSTGVNPRIRIRAEENCINVVLRKHPRHLVSGKVRLGQEGDMESYNQVTSHELDISIGGFGLIAPDNDYKVDDEIEFNLELTYKDGKQSANDGLSIEISGRAAIRRASEMKDGDKIQLGFQFLSLNDADKQSLEHWLTVLDSLQRLD